MSTYELIQFGFHLGLGLAGGGYVAFVLIGAINESVSAVFDYIKRDKS